MLRKLARKCPVGKKTQEALYVHADCIFLLPEELQHLVRQAAKLLLPGDEGPTLFKFALSSGNVSFLYYPEFAEDPHPRLRQAITIKFDGEGQPCLPARRTYDWRKNPPILHRKELFVSEHYPNRIKFAALTEMEESQGLLGSNRIGLKKQWEELLAARGLEIRDHKLLTRE